MVPNFRFNLQMEVKHVNLLQDQERVELLGSNFPGIFPPERAQILYLKEGTSIGIRSIVCIKGVM